MVKLLLSYPRKRAAFGKVLSQESIEVLVGAALPGVVGMSKIDCHTCVLL